MELNFNLDLVQKYKSTTQKIRVLSESWVEKQIYCPSCGKAIIAYRNNKPVADFFCELCKEDYELKSKKNSFGQKVVDGAYASMIERLESKNNPNFFFLSYRNFQINNFVLIPKHFFQTSLIEQRKPLSSTARRAGWVGCNILLKNIPESGKIFYVRNGCLEKKSTVMQKWKKTFFLRDCRQEKLKGWILDVMNCIDKLDKREFNLSDIYSFENLLQEKHPDNNHVKDKIRQQLQILRDKGYLEFISRGKYRLV